MKKTILLLLFSLSSGLLRGENFPLHGPSDAKFDRYAATIIDGKVSSMQDLELNRDVLRLHYRVKPGINRAVNFTIALPEIQKIQWKSINTIKLHYKGGLGHIYVTVCDRDGEKFTSKCIQRLGGSSWSGKDYGYRQMDEKHCHIYHPKKALENKIPDSPFRITGIRIVIYPNYIAEQLRKTNVVAHGEKLTGREAAQGMAPVDLLLSGLEVDGVRAESRKDASQAVLPIRNWSLRYSSRSVRELKK